MKRLFQVFVLLLPCFSIGQTLAPDLWYEGEVILENKDTVKGLIKYDQDLLQVTRNNHSEIFPAEKVLYFDIFDQTVKSFRRFYSFPFSTKGGYKKPIFFELLSKGKLTLIARERIGIVTFSQSTNITPPKLHRVLISNYYLIGEGGEIKKNSGKPAKLYNLMTDKSNVIHQYAHENQLNLENKRHIKKIFDYYNSLF